MICEYAGKRTNFTAYLLLSRDDFISRIPRNFAYDEELAINQLDPQVSSWRGEAGGDVWWWWWCREGVVKMARTVVDSGVACGEIDSSLWWVGEAVKKCGDDNDEVSGKTWTGR